MPHGPHDLKTVKENERSAPLVYWSQLCRQENDLNRFLFEDLDLQYVISLSWLAKVGNEGQAVN